MSDGLQMKGTLGKKAASASRKLTFERVLRDCPRNEQLVRKGVTRGLLYDFKALLDGQHIAWWNQYSPNGGTDTQGFRYWLSDKMWEPISSGYGHDHHPIAVHNREEFESGLLANLDRIPTDDELAQRKLDQERKEEQKRAEEDAAKRLRQMELAAPDLLTFVRKQHAETNCICGLQGKFKGTRFETNMECVKCETARLIAKAEKTA